MQVSTDTAIKIVHGKHSDFTPETDKKHVKASTWVVLVERVFRHTPTNRFYKIRWGDPLFEFRSETFESDPVELVEVKPHLQRVFIEA